MKIFYRITSLLILIASVLLFVPKTSVVAVPSEPTDSDAAISNDADLQKAIAQVKPGSTIYVTDMQITKELKFEAPAIQSLDVILASTNGNPVTLDISGTGYPAFAFNFHGLSDVKLTFQNVRIDGGQSGRAIRFSQDGGTLTLNGAVFQNNLAKANGGAVHVDYGNATLNDCTFQNNVTEGNGGGIFLRSGDLYASNCNFTGNKAQYNGGGAYVGKYSGKMGNGEATIRNCTFDGNIAPSFGGALLTDGDIDIKDSIIKNNTASMAGGIYSESSAILMDTCQITGNASTIDDATAEIYENYGFITGGGGILSMSSNIAISNSTIQNNTTTQHGGGIRSSGGDVTLNNSTVTGNRSGKDGGGVWISDLVRLFTHNVDFYGNQASMDYKWTLDETEEADIHRANIVNTTFTTPFTNAFNNFDVNFIRDVPNPPSEPETVQTPQPTTPEASNGTTEPTVRPEPTATPRPTTPSGSGGGVGGTTPTQPLPSPPNGGQLVPDGDGSYDVLDRDGSSTGESLIPNGDGTYDVVDGDGQKVGEWEKDTDGNWIYRALNQRIPWYFAFLLGVLFSFCMYLLYLLLKKHYITRAEFVDRIVQAIPLEEIKEDAIAYEDVLKDSDFYHPMMKAKSANLLTGFTGVKFHPDIPITREEMASVLAEVVRRRNPSIKTEDIRLENTFKDSDKMSKRFYDDIKLVCTFHMMTEASDEEFDPQGFLTNRKTKAIMENLLNAIGMGD